MTPVFFPSPLLLYDSAFHIFAIPSLCFLSSSSFSVCPSQLMSSLSLPPLPSPGPLPPFPHCYSPLSFSPSSFSLLSHDAHPTSLISYQCFFSLLSISSNSIKARPYEGFFLSFNLSFAIQISLSTHPQNSFKEAGKG